MCLNIIVLELRGQGKLGYEEIAREWERRSSSWFNRDSNKKDISQVLSLYAITWLDHPIFIMEKIVFLLVHRAIIFESKIVFSVEAMFLATQIITGKLLVCPGNEPFVNLCFIPLKLLKGDKYIY